MGFSSVYQSVRTALSRFSIVSVLVTFLTYATLRFCPGFGLDALTVQELFFAFAWSLHGTDTLEPPESTEAWSLNSTHPRTYGIPQCYRSMILRSAFVVDVVHYRLAWSGAPSKTLQPAGFLSLSRPFFLSFFLPEEAKRIGSLRLQSLTPPLPTRHFLYPLFRFPLLEMSFGSAIGHSMATTPAANIIYPSSPGAMWLSKGLLPQLMLDQLVVASAWWSQ